MFLIIPLQNYSTPVRKYRTAPTKMILMKQFLHVQCHPKDKEGGVHICLILRANMRNFTKLSKLG
jgi:hypothetical protein